MRLDRAKLCLFFSSFHYTIHFRINLNLFLKDTDAASWLELCKYEAMILKAIWINLWEMVWWTVMITSIESKVGNFQTLPKGNHSHTWTLSCSCAWVSFTEAHQWKRCATDVQILCPVQTDIQLHVKALTRTHTEIKSWDVISRAIAATKI